MNRPLRELISVVIPAKNEAGGIAELITKANSIADEIIVIDGHSSDDTSELARGAGARVWQDNGKGKGAAYRLGIKKATREVIIFMDADGSHEILDIPKLAKPILTDKADLVIASRHKGGSDEWDGDLDTYLRSIGSGVLTLLINYRWGTNLTDCLNGFRAIRRDTALKLPLRADGFDIEQHMIVQCLKYGYRVTEVASHEYIRSWGHSKLPTYRKAYLFFGRLFLDFVTGFPKGKNHRSFSND